MQIVGRTIVITGATAGIGRELVAQLSSANKVLALGRDQEKLDALKKDFPSISIYQIDLAQLGELPECCRQLVDERGVIDVLINNAAMQFAPQFHAADFSADRLKEEVNCNFTAICLLIHGLLPALKQASSGVVLNINSGLAIAPKTNGAVYCATKSALDSLSTSLSYQFEGTSIKILQAFLPMVDTEMTRGRGKGKLSAAKAAEQIIRGLAAENPRYYIGKVKVLALINRIYPHLAKKIMKQW